MRVLVVENEAKLAVVVKNGLLADRHTVSIASTGEEGFLLAQTQIFDLIVVEVILPGRDGIEILGHIRRLGNRTPVLLLSSKDALTDRIRGLDAGADDYLTRPFAVSELQARVRAIGRRGMAEIGNRLRLGDLEMDRIRHIATREGITLYPTAREFALLEYFLCQAGEVVSRDTLARELWKESSRDAAIDNLIDTHIARLRRKLDDPFEEKMLHTVRGVGFVLRVDAKNNKSATVS